MPILSTHGVDLYYEFSGPETAPVVVFSNSLGTNLEMWDLQVAHFSKTYRCLRYDTRGHGRSQVVEKAATIYDLADDLAGLLDALNIARVHLVGLSLGGMTAQAFAILHPARLMSITLMATAAYMPANWDERAVLVRTKGMDSLTNAIMERWFAPAFRASQPAQIAAIAASFNKLSPEGYAASCFAVRDMDLRDDIAAIKIPTLIIAGADDTATPPEKMLEIQRHIEGSELIVLPKAAHLLNIEQPEKVNFHLENFLAQHALAAAADVRLVRGLTNRKAVLGDAHVANSLANANWFDMPWQEFITRTAWGDVWGDNTLPLKIRSMLTLAMMVCLGHEEEFKLHLRPALKNGVTLRELQALLTQTAIYAGVPAANGAFRMAKMTLASEIGFQVQQIYDVK